MTHRRRITALVMASALALSLTGAPQATAFPTPDPGYQFSRVQRNGSTPVALTCKAHPVLVNTNGHDPNLLSQAQRAITDTAAATGLNLFYAGPTSQSWASPSPPIRRLKRAPIWISFENHSSFPAWTSPWTVGIAQSSIMTINNRRGPKGIVWFKVIIDADAYATKKAEEGQAEADRFAYTVLIHELAHGVGLDHTESPTQIMYPTNVPEISTFGSGDRVGLSILGRSACQVGKATALKKHKKPHKKRKSKRKTRPAQRRELLPIGASAPGVVTWQIHQ
ncbi:MAG: matrixin family metalloprotease [Nocardioidaceae bacterium]|jgi:hypothetical protein